MDFLTSISELAKMKQLDKDEILEIVKECLIAAISKKIVLEDSLQIKIVPPQSIFAVFDKIVVEADKDKHLGEISIDEAIKINPKLELGDKVPFEMEIQNFEPKIIKNAKKSILERIKKLESNRIIFDYEKQKNQIVMGIVRQQNPKGYLIDLGYMNAFLTKDQQIEDEFYKIDEKIIAYVINLRKTRDDITLILSRTNPEFVKKLFEREVPEISDESISIKKIVREPGKQCKIAVVSNSKDVDALGAMLGEKCSRLENVKRELHGEQIDIVLWSEYMEQFIAHAVGINLVEQVFISEYGNFARVITSQKNKNIAIGKQGRNVKLATKLTEYKIDIFTLEEFEEQIAKERRIMSHLDNLDGTSPKVVKDLKDKGYSSVEDIYNASLEELSEIITKKVAEKIKEAAKNY